MTRLFFTFVLLASPALAVPGFTTVDDYQNDFETARPCAAIGGRMVWKGEAAYYIQSWLFQTGESGILSDDAATAVSMADNTPDSLAPFKAACS